jgi:hypothetical protein
MGPVATVGACSGVGNRDRQGKGPRARSGAKTARNHPQDPTNEEGRLGPAKTQKVLEISRSTVTCQHRLQAGGHGLESRWLHSLTQTHSRSAYRVLLLSWAGDGRGSTPRRDLSVIEASGNDVVARVVLLVDPVCRRRRRVRVLLREVALTDPASVYVRPLYPVPIGDGLDGRRQIGAIPRKATLEARCSRRAAPAIACHAAGRGSRSRSRRGHGSLAHQ